MTEKERLEVLKTQIAQLKNAESKIRTVRQDLESQAQKLIFEMKK